MLGPERPEAVLPDIPFLIVNKASLSPLRQLPIAGEYLHVYVCNFLHGFVLSTLGRRRENSREAVCSHIGAVLSTCELIDLIGEKTGGLSMRPPTCLAGFAVEGRGCVGRPQGRKQIFSCPAGGRRKR
jgi:hypothetical protein